MARRRAGRVSWIASVNLALPLEHLRNLGVAPRKAMSVAEPLDELLERYRYLVAERGLVATTIRTYLRVARLFCLELDGRGSDVFEVGYLRADLVRLHLTSNALACTMELRYDNTMIIDKDEDGEARSPLIFRLEPRSGVPTYLQLVHQVEHAIRLGYLGRGDQLPRLKDVVASLSINPNTVQKAYRHLEQEGLIGARPGQGTFVLASPETIGLAELNALRKNLVDGWLRDAAAAGLDEQGISALFQSALRDFREGQSGTARRPQARRDSSAPRSQGVA